MKNFIYVSALILGLTFVTSCGEDDEDDKTCITCNAIISDVTVCDNGDGTATYEFAGISETIDIPEGESIDDLSCDDLFETDI